MGTLLENMSQSNSLSEKEEVWYNKRRRINLVQEFFLFFNLDNLCYKNKLYFDF